MSRKTRFHQLGIIEYKQAWEFQESLFNPLLQNKLSRSAKDNNPSQELYNHLIFCEHPHVYTLGKSGSVENLLINQIQLQAKNATFFHTNRGGDITYHGPGQLVGYPIIDLEVFNLEVKKYIYLLEESIIVLLKDFNITATRLEGATGVWIEPNTKNARKICAIGVKASRHITMHGFAFNINTDLSYFNYINPCGFTDKSVTSLQKELNQPMDFNLVSAKLKDVMTSLFRFEWIA